MGEPPETHWNYRVVQTVENDEPMWGIYEVYYEHGIPVARTVNPISFISEEGVEELADALHAAIRGTTEPVLTDADIGVEYD